LYGWKCQDARAAVFESSVLVAHFDDHFEKSFYYFSFGACVCASFGGERGERERRKKRKLENLKIKKKFDLQKVKNRKRREKKSRLVVKLVQYQSFPSK
jgi:hypothetical protein